MRERKRDKESENEIYRAREREGVIVGKYIKAIKAPCFYFPHL